MDGIKEHDVSTISTGETEVLEIYLVSDIRLEIHQGYDQHDTKY
jgi:hypothetical protein